MEPITLQTPQTRGTNEQVDPTALALSRSIRSTENTRYDQVVKEPDGSQSFGAYGWNRDNFKTWANQYGLDPNDTSEVNQDHLAYLRIKDLLDQGKSQSEIAAIWNGAKKVNGKHVALNPQYVERVKNAYLAEISGTGSTAPSNEVPKLEISQKQAKIPSEQKTDEQELGSNLKGRVQELGKALDLTVKSPYKALTQGNVLENVGHGLSGLIQTGGAVAGVIGDIANYGLNKASFGLFKKFTNLVGEGIGELAKTETGQAISNSVNEFVQKNPELAKDIEAGINIVSTIPILKGLNVASTATKDALSVALKKPVLNSFDKTLTDVVKTSGKQAVSFIRENKGIFKEMGERGIIPDVESNGVRSVYRVGQAIDDSWNEIGNLGKKVTEKLKNNPYIATEKDATNIIKNAIKKSFPEADKSFVYKFIDNAKNLTAGSEKIWQRLGSGTATLEDINTLRSQLDQAVKSVYQSVTAPPIEKEMGAALADSMRTFVKATAKETEPLFNEMSKQFQFQKALGYLEGKGVKSGVLGEVAKNAASVAGEKLGGLAGVSYAPAIAGRRLGGLAEGLKGRIITGMVKRAAPEAERVTLSQAKKGLIKTATGATLNRVNK